jgi:transcriptional regulator with XRE-family HTH domain
MMSGDQMKAARKFLGWSQLTLAAEAGLDPATIALFETGKKQMSDGHRWKVLRAAKGRESQKA